MNIDLSSLDSAITQKIASLSGENLQGVADAAADVFMRSVESRAPVRSGELKASIGEIDKVGTHKASSAVQIENSAKGGPVFYAAMLEYGTSKMTARPFMRPAYESAEEDAKQSAIDAAAKLIGN